MIAFCGIKCLECPVYEATKNNDDEARGQVARKWTEDYGWNLSPEDINCTGCLDKDGTIFSYCRQCAVRACGMAEGVDNCAHCDDYGCSKLKYIWSLSPVGRSILEDIRRGR